MLILHLKLMASMTDGFLFRFIGDSS